MSLSCRVEDRRLPISIDVVDVAIALCDKVVKKVELSIASGVVQGSLVEVVWLLRLHAELSEYLGHADSLVIALDLTRLEHGGLFVVGFVQELRYVVDCIMALLQDLIDVAVLD